MSMTETESELLSQLDFEPPCEVRTEDDTDPCDAAARWMLYTVTEKKHNPSEKQLLSCDYHRKQAEDPGLICLHCGTTIKLVHAEPL